MDVDQESCADPIIGKMLDDILTRLKTLPASSSSVWQFTSRDDADVTLSRADYEFVTSRIIQIRRRFRVQRSLRHQMDEGRRLVYAITPRSSFVTSSSPRLQPADDINNDVEVDCSVYDATSSSTDDGSDAIKRQETISRNKPSATAEARCSSSRGLVNSRILVAGRPAIVRNQAETSDRQPSDSMILSSPRKLISNGRYDLVDKLMAQNARLKLALRKVTAQQYGSTHDFLTIEELNDVITQLRQDVQRWQHHSECIRSIVAAKSSDNQTERLSRKCLELSERVLRLEKALDVKQTMLTDLIADVTTKRHSRGFQDVSACTSSDELTAREESNVVYESCHPAEQLVSDLESLRSTYSESEKRYRSEILSLRHEVQRLRTDLESRALVSRTDLHISKCDVAVDCGTSLVSLEPIDIVRPPSPSRAITDSNVQVTSFKTDAVYGELVCPRCEIQFYDERRYGDHCMKCTDD